MSDWLDVYRVGRYASPSHRGVVPLWKRVREQFRTDRYGRIWQAEAEDIQRCPRAWTRMGCVLKAMRWAQNGRHGWGVHAWRADQFDAYRRQAAEHRAGRLNRRKTGAAAPSPEEEA